MHDEIASTVHAKFRNLPKKGKPTADEWTVLCGIVLIYPSKPALKNASLPSSIECVSIGTGLKCLSKSSVKDGFVLNDSHAEVICRRNFQRFLWNEIKRLKMGGLSVLLPVIDSEDVSGIMDQEVAPQHLGTEIKGMDSHDFKYRLDPEIEVVMYTSHAPCGDSSTEALLAHLEADVTQEGHPIEAMHHDPTSVYKKQKMEDGQGCSIDSSGTVGSINKFKELPSDNIALRGRSKPGLTGLLRTKPARNDCEPTLSMSCSDKIARWNILGLCGSILSQVIEPIYIDTLIVGDLFNEMALSRLNSRIASCEFKAPYRINTMTIVHTTISWSHSKYTMISKNKSEPLCCPSSVSWSKGEKSESIVNGRKQGACMKNGAWAPSSSSLISRRNLFLLARVHLNQSVGESFNEVKLKSVPYQLIKRMLLNGVLKGWVGNSCNFNK